MKGGSCLDNRLLMKTAIKNVLLMIFVIVISFAIKHYNSLAISASNTQDEKAYYNKLTKDNDNNQTKTKKANKSVLKQLQDQYLIIKKPKGDDLQIQLQDLYINRSLKIIISGYMDEIIDGDYISRVYKEEKFIGEPDYVEVDTSENDEDGLESSDPIRDYGNDPVHEITISSQSDNLGYREYEILLKLNHVYAHILYEDDNNYYIDLRRPKDVYDKILVIDAGHGGKDPGALSKDGNTYEKEINIKILSALKELIDNDDIKVYYTRLSDETIFLRPRFTLANEVDCDFFISIHCNASTSTRPNGTEILYYDHEHKDIKTVDFAGILSEEISKIVPLKNNGLVRMQNNDIFILRNAKVPAVIIEAGYMTNNNDLKYLKSAAGQEDIAKGIYNGILRAYEELIP